MELKRTTSLYFCEDCGALRLREVKDQLQKLFAEESTKPNVCGICKKSMVIQQPNIKTEISIEDVDEEHTRTSRSKVTRLSTGVLQPKRYTDTAEGAGSNDDDFDDYEIDEDYDYDDNCNADDDSDNNYSDPATEDPTTILHQGNTLIKNETLQITNEEKPVSGTAGLDPELLKLMTPTDDPMLPFKCKFCDVSPFRKLVVFQKHVRSHTGQAPLKKPFKCDVCAKRFIRSAYLTQHQVTHATFECSVDGCEFTFRSKNDLKCHFKVHSGEMPLQCDTCGLGFKLKPSLVVHQTIHSDKRPFSCTYCDKTFSHKRYFKSHQKNHVNTDKYKCDLCIFTCQRESTIQLHKKTHSNRGTFKCEKCEFVFKYKKMLIRHLKINKCEMTKPPSDKKPRRGAVPQGVDIDLSEITRWLDPRVVAMMDKPRSIDTPFKCKYCKTKSTEWQRPNSLVKHIRETHPKEPVVTRPHVCDSCDKTFEVQSDLKLHYMNHTGEKPYQCDRPGCGKKFTAKTYLKSHEIYVHDTKKFICSHCGTKYVTNHKLKLHEARVHLKLKPYPCQYCGQAFSAKDKRANHEKRLHSSDKPYMCETCGRAFAVNMDLIAHTRMHSAEKPYACDRCDYRCKRLDYLRKHHRNHTGEKPYQCKHCGMRLSQRTALVLHERKHSVTDIEMSKPPQRPAHQVAANKVVTTASSDLPSCDEIRNATNSIAMNMNCMF